MALAFLALTSVPAALAASSAGAAAPPAGEEASGKRADLDELKQRIEALQKDLAATESTQAEEARAVAETERAVSAARRQARQTIAERARIESENQVLNERLQGLQAQLAEARAHFSEWLHRAYVKESLASGVPLLGAGGEAPLTRDAYYLERIGKARLEAAEQLRAQMAEQTRLGEELAARRAKLVELEQRARKEETELQLALSQRQAKVAELADKARDQKKAVEDLREDEKRLARVIDELTRLARKQAAEAAARAAAEASARAAREKAERERAERAGRMEGVQAERLARTEPAENREEPAREPRSERKAPAEPSRGEARASAGPTPTGVRFAQLQGRIGFPVRGELVGRFGTPRAGGGTTWRGVFIRASAGTEVKAVAAGQVVFSDWLRGFGNLIIVDHGDDYLTIYGNNDALLKTVGQSVNGGETLASVGASGGEAESGLYFEIRHEGRPVDPQKWVRTN